MPDSVTNSAKRTPVHLWIVGVLAVLWNAVGAFDYWMTQTQNAAYMGQFSPEQLDYYYGFPFWVVLTWGIATWGGLLGAVLLLLRRRLATPVFLISIIAMLITTTHNYALSNGMEIAGGASAIVMSAVIAVIAFGLYFYSRAMQKRAVLR